MAVRENLTHPIPDFQEHWDGHTGQEVETFITEKLIDADNNLITSATFLGTTLTLNKKGENTPPIEIQVVIAEPTYTFNIFVYGLVLNGNYSDIKRTGNSLITQYSSGKTFHLGVALVAYTDTVGTKNNITAAQPITISYGNDNKSANFTVIPIDYNKVVVNNEGIITGFADGVDPVTDIAWIDITQLFTESGEGAITASYSIEAKSEGQYKTFTGSYTLPIATIKNEVVNLSYSGDIVNGTTVAEFTTDRDNSDYRLQGFVIKNNNINSPETISGLDNLSYTNLVPGLNQFIVKAVNRSNPDVFTDYIAVDIICTAGLDHAVIAVNNVKNTIANNGVAELYALTVYSPTGGDNISIDTYVTDTLQLNEEEIPASALVKSDVISDSSYEEKTVGFVFNSNYQKYMEISGGGEQYLYIKTGDTWYKFLTIVDDSVYANTYRDMVVEPLNNNLTYYPSGISLTFDQIKGCVNNVFRTKEYFPSSYNINPALEVSDGWIEEGGRNIFRVSAQATPVFDVPQALNLQDQFTLEFGFKSYNLSNTHAPVVTIGNLQLRPLELCWDVNETAENELINDTFTARNSQFQENVETHIIMTVKKGAKITDDGIYYPNYLDIYGTENNLAKLNNQTINLVRIYINGVIDREYILKDDELNSLKAASMLINPTGSDIDFYVLRVYNSTALNFDQVKRNYLSFLKSKDSKLAFFNANDILGTNGEISFNKCLGKYNTMVYVLPAGYKQVQGNTNDTGRFPNRAWGYANNSPAQDNVMKKAKVSMFINYAPDPNVPNKNEIYGGRLDNMQIKSQGSSAERYLIWNVGAQMDKFKDGNGKKIKSMFTPYSNLDSNNRFVENPTDKKNYYLMPYYNGEVDQTEYQAKKFVGKVNFASSMQSHKLGASRLYDDAFKNNAISMPEVIEGATYGSKKAPHDEPFLYFYWEPNMDNDQVAQCDLADIIAAGSQVKFMGFHTWGPAKTDKAYMGINNNVPEYLIVEGGENKDVAVNFRVPWHALQRANKDEDELTTDDLLQYQLEYAPTTDYDPTQSWKRLLIHDESICYSGKSGAWDVDCGLEGDPIIESDDGVTSFWKISEKAHNSINRFRAFYDFVYSHDYTFNVCAATTPDPSNSTSTDEFGNPVLEEDGSVSNKWDVKKKYLVTSNASPIAGYTEHRPFDIYRYENYSGQWVPAGVSYDRANNRWNRLTIWDMSGLNTSVRDIDANRNAIKMRIWGTWTNSGVAAGNGKKGDTRVTVGELAQYIHLQDLAFHQALVKFLSGTDNRAKNTYFQMVGPLYHTVEVSPAVYYTQEEADEINAEHVGDAEWTPVTTLDIKTEAVTSFEPINAPGTQAYEDSYKLRMFGWDLDTVIITDNNGLQTKPYNLVEASYNRDHNRYWGDAHNIFFYMFDQGYEDYIKQQLRGILKYAFANPVVTNTGNYFYKNFFDIQDNQFPAVSYNHQAKIYYENAQFIFDAGIIDVYTNNDVRVPVSQSHGCAAPCEKQFMQKRYDFLASYALIVGSQDIYNFTSSTGGSGVSEARLRMQFVPYQDFYPTYYWNRDDNFKYLAVLEDSQFDTNKYLAKTGQSYDVKLHETDEGINNALQSLNKYKELTITGIQNRTLSVELLHNTDFKIDNAIKDEDPVFFQGWGDTTLNALSPNAPVLENLSLRNMELPSQIDLSSFRKLKKIDFTGTNINYVILPQSGRLETVILPATVTEFRLYNNPGIKATVNETVDNELIQEGIIIPNPAGLRTVYVNGGNAGQFNVSAFCTSLANANLASLTLRNVNIRITEATLSALMATPNCSISGKIVIVDDNNAQAPISFNTLQSLVSKFGNIRSEENSLYVSFANINTQIVRAPATIALYNVGAEAQVTPSVDGNDVKIVADNSVASGYRLDINYYLRTTNSYQAQSNFPTGTATINSITGKITLVQTSTQKGYVFIRVGTLAGGDKVTSTSNSCEVTFSWIAPKIGDFAYEDGTFSASFISSKALMGLVYAVKETDSNSGTAYIIGKEYSFKNSQTSEPIATYMGLTMETGRQAQNRYQTSTYYLNRYARQILQISDALFTDGLADVIVSNLSDIGKVDQITYSTYGVSHMSSDEFSHFTGKQDTLTYINAVNRYVLPKLRLFYANASHPNTTIVNNLESYGSDGYYRIANNEALNKIYNALYSMSIKYDDTTYDGYAQYVQTGLATAVIFPYVYSMYVYQPEATSLDAQYEAGNWYMPSLGQLQRVIYHRGISARTTGSDLNFSSTQSSYVMLNVSGVAGQGAKGAIFSTAFNAIRAAGGNFPQCWQNLIGSSLSEASVSSTASNSYNLVTALSANGNNYGYQNTTGNGNPYSYNANWSMKWISGQMPVEGNSYTTYVDYPGSYNTWSLYNTSMPDHLGIPFVEYNYLRPS